MEVTVTSPGRGRLNGFYEARARTAGGEIVGQWHSIPLNRNRRQSLELTLGGGARLLAAKPLAATGSLGSGLGPNAPNPFNSSTQISYRLAAPGPVRLVIYNALGQQVRTLVDQFHAPGEYRVVWDARDQQGAAVASGVYVIRLRHAHGVQARQLLYLK